MQKEFLHSVIIKNNHRQIKDGKPKSKGCQRDRDFRILIYKNLKCTE